MSEAERLHDLFERAWARSMTEHPEVATYTGWPEGHDRWTDHSAGAIARRKKEVGDFLVEARTFDRAGLDDAVDRTSLEMFTALEQMAVDDSEFPSELLKLNQLEGPQVDPAFLLGVMPRQTRRHHDDLLARLRRLPDLVDEHIELLRQGRAAGITPPQICLREVPTQIEAHLSDDPTTNPELIAFAGTPDDLAAEARNVVHEAVAPAFARLATYVRDAYLPACRTSTAWRDLPDGSAWYAERVRHHTTTDMSPREIHDIGLAEVARISAPMDEVMATTGFSGTREEFAVILRTDPRFYFDSEDALLGFYRDIAKRIDAQVVRLFGRLPRLPFGISPVPAEQAPSQPAAYYLQGSMELSRPGMFYANTYDLSARPVWNMESICLHEAVPGHHFQISLAQETEGLPKFRQEGGTTAYIEGWGLYCESLGDELGLYTDPYQRFGRLDAEMMRACRLVLDTGMHALGWSRDRAIAYFTSVSPSPEHDLIVEVDRYLVWPGQALSYKVGELRMQSLRQQSAAALGDRFDKRAFHDELLRHGALPLDLLDRVMADWLASLS